MERVKTKKNLKLRNKNVTPAEPNLWVHLHALTQHWQSDLEFYDDELAFFRILIDKHLEILIDQKNITQTRKLVSQVDGLEKVRRSTAEKIRKHLTHISELIENPFVQNAQAFKVEHEALETEFLEFVNQYRAVKREVFKLMEQIIRSGKVTKLIERP